MVKFSRTICVIEIINENVVSFVVSDWLANHADFQLNFWEI